MINRNYHNDLQVLRETLSDFIEQDLTLKPQNIDMAIRHFALSVTSIINICETSGVSIESITKNRHFDDFFVSNLNFNQLDAYQLREALTSLVSQGYGLSYEYDYVSISAWLIMCDRVLRLSDL